MSELEVLVGRPDIYQECLDHFNEPVIAGLSVARLIGYAETAVDCYYILREPQKGVYWHTAVGGVIFLSCLSGNNAFHHPSEGRVDDLVRLDKWLEFSGVPKDAGLQLALRPNDEEEPYAKDS
jgi:hypothetical protein